MKETTPRPKARSEPVRRTFQKLEIEDGERRPGVAERLKHLFRRRKRVTPGTL